MPICTNGFGRPQFQPESLYAYPEMFGLKVKCDFPTAPRFVRCISPFSCSTQPSRLPISPQAQCRIRSPFKALNHVICEASKDCYPWDLSPCLSLAWSVQFCGPFPQICEWKIFQIHIQRLRIPTPNLVIYREFFPFFPPVFSYAESWGAILSLSTSVGLKYGLLCYAYSTPTIFVRTSGQRYALSSRRPRSIGLAGSIGNPEIRVTLGLTKTY